MKARANFILIACTVLCACAAVWIDWSAVALAALALGIHKGRPIALDWFDE